MRNRLEQLRKRQRDEALQAQEELLAGVAKNAQEGLVDTTEAKPSAEDKHSGKPSEIVEPYDRSMSPELLDKKRLSYEDKQLDIVDAIEDLKNLVGF